MFQKMNILISFIILSAVFYASGCAFAGNARCEHPMGDVELYSKLASNPYFANGIPPPGKVMRVEREECNYKIYIGDKSPDAFNGDILIVDDNGKIVDIIRTY